MKILLLLILTLCTGSTAICQSCLSGGIAFDYQWQVDEFPVNFPGCRHILGHVIISDSANIFNLDSLYSIDSISGDLQLWHNSVLPNFKGLDQLTYLGGDLNVYQSSGLEDYHGLENLTYIKGDFNYDQFNKVESFANFKSLTEIGGTLRLNSLAKNHLDFPVLQSISGNLYISYTDPGAMENGEDIIFIGPDSLKVVGGDLRFGKDFIEINDPPFPCREITHILGFNQLDTIGGTLSFYFCNYLRDASGLSSLKYIGKDLDFYLAKELQMNFLSQVDHIGGSFISAFSGRDTTLMFLNKLQHLGKHFFLSIHRTRDLLPLKSFAQINGSIVISSCSFLPTLQDLDNITTINGSLTISNNNALTTLSGLELLSHIKDSLIILNNPILSSIENLSPNLTFNKYLEIQSNSLLSICNADPICAYMEDPLAPALIADNLPGCNSRPEVEEACGIVYIQSPQAMQWHISPNPGDGLYRIISDIPQAEIQLSLFDLPGRPIMQQSFIAGNTLDLQHLAPGTYLLQIRYQDQTWNQLIQKL